MHDFLREYEAFLIQGTGDEFPFVHMGREKGRNTNESWSAACLDVVAWCVYVYGLLYLATSVVLKSRGYMFYTVS